jgi:hypothetical protein
MTEKLDYKKEFKDLYMPKEIPALVDVPPMIFVAVDGQGDPHGKDYAEAMEILYGISWTIKMKGRSAEGYYDHTVPPLEGLWNGAADAESLKRRDLWKWTSMLRLPDFVDRDLFEMMREECRKKKSDADLSRAYFKEFEEGLCVQIMHVGPYSDETGSISKMTAFANENGLRFISGEKKHHEIYISDPRKVSPEKLRTVLRLPVEKE